MKQVGLENTAHSPVVPCHHSSTSSIYSIIRRDDTSQILLVHHCLGRLQSPRGSFLVVITILIVTRRSGKSPKNVIEIPIAITVISPGHLLVRNTFNLLNKTKQHSTNESTYVLCIEIIYWPIPPFM